MNKTLATSKQDPRYMHNNQTKDKEDPSQMLAIQSKRKQYPDHN